MRMAANGFQVLNSNVKDSFLEIFFSYILVRVWFVTSICEYYKRNISQNALNFNRNHKDINCKINAIQMFCTRKRHAGSKDHSAINFRVLCQYKTANDDGCSTTSFTVRHKIISVLQIHIKVTTKGRRFECFIHIYLI